MALQRVRQRYFRKRNRRDRISACRAKKATKLRPHGVDQARQACAGRTESQLCWLGALA